MNIGSGKSGGIGKVVGEGMMALKKGSCIAPSAAGLVEEASESEGLLPDLISDGLFTSTESADFGMWW